jgi:hypothetical protein
MAKRKPATDVAGEGRELAATDFVRVKLFSGLPKGLQTKLRKVGQRGLQTASTKKLVSLCYPRKF